MDSNEEIKSLLVGVTIRLESVAILLAEVKLLADFDKSVNEPPVPAEPIAEPFGEPGPRLPSFEEMRKSEAGASLVSDDLEPTGQLDHDYR